MKCKSHTKCITATVVVIEEITYKYRQVYLSRIFYYDYNRDDDNKSDCYTDGDDSSGVGDSWQVKLSLFVYDFFNYYDCCSDTLSLDELITFPHPLIATLLIKHL